MAIAIEGCRPSLHAFAKNDASSFAVKSHPLVVARIARIPCLGGCQAPVVSSFCWRSANPAPQGNHHHSSWPVRQQHRKPVLAAAVPRTRHQPGWQPRRVCDRGRRPQGCLLLPERRHALHPARHPHRPGAARDQQHPDRPLQEHLQSREFLYRQKTASAPATTGAMATRRASPSTRRSWR